MKCPECGFNNKKSAYTCKGCDAELPTRAVSHSLSSPKTCQFHDGSRYCPAPGISTTGDGWWCHWHKQFNSFNENRLILDNLLEQGVPHLKDWRDQLVELTMRGVSGEEARKQVFGKHEGI